MAENVNIKINIDGSGSTKTLGQLEVYAGTDFSLYPESWYNGLHLTDYGNDQLGKDDADLISSLI